MSDYKICVAIQGRFGEVVAEVFVPMDRFLQDTIQPLKMSDGPMPFFDTPRETVRRVKADRAATARILSPKITEALLDAMAAKDLFNGYTKQELKKP